MIAKPKNSPICPITAALDVLGGKWKVFILSYLAEHGTLRFGELKRLIPKVTQKMLAQQLKELEEAGLVNRRVYAQVPPKVEYRLTAHGETLCPVLHSLREWGNLHREVLGLGEAPCAEAASDVLVAAG
ncbi:HxlR family transcriptional regulator [Hymenobacter qilianensis]|uniref:HxlR family transcriptional regulator n=2 Tax=Hymenobacter qilianensis TaxID=1385715 RepID=A0ACB5PPJ3_9BACT|nr:helix-turn-helix domain-containing protein [Hymenobacter qilianensis]QNP53151.1 helix-turn-helix transcriptional regulator [Hymenobacter qilianensis]GGF59278.1 HxlR family transcriptional regulator [Hymenobacter qilianensis]